MPQITALIADRHETRRAACARILGSEKRLQLLQMAPSGPTDLSVITEIDPPILLLDLNLLKGKKISRLFVLRQICAQTKVILLTRQASEARILDALSCGVRGYIEEKALEAYLAKAVRCVAAGEAWVPRKMVARIIERWTRITAGE